MDEILRLRAKIDNIDEGILLQLRARSETAQHLGNIKRVRGLPIRDPGREKNILREIEKTASSLGLSPTHTRKIFENIVRLSIDAQISTVDNKTQNSLADLDCLIVGGTGEMGRLFVHMMVSQGARVRVVGHNQRSTTRGARQIGVEPGRIRDSQESDIVIISVPIAVTAAIATKAASRMRNGSLLCDLSSVKTGVADQIARTTPRGIEYVSLHPLFGPYIETVHDQTLLLVKDRVGRTWEHLERTFEKLGLVLIETTIKQHDLVMSYVQAMYHFVLVSLGASLGPWDGSFKTSSLRLTLERLGAVCENRRTIAAIQEYNPYSSRARQEFTGTTRRLAEASPETFRRMLETLDQHVQKWSRKR